MPPRRNVSLVVVILAVNFVFELPKTGVPTFRWGDTAAAQAIGGRNHSIADLLLLVLRVGPHLNLHAGARALIISIVQKKGSTQWVSQ